MLLMPRLLLAKLVLSLGLNQPLIIALSRLNIYLRSIAIQMPKSNIKLLRIFGFLEGISYLLLLGVSMPLKYLYDMKEFSFNVGLVHGVLFCLYVFLVFLVTVQLKWSLKKCLWAQVAGLLPFGTFIADRKLFRSNAIENN